VLEPALALGKHLGQRLSFLHAVALTSWGVTLKRTEWPRRCIHASMRSAIKIILSLIDAALVPGSSALRKAPLLSAMIKVSSATVIRRPVCSEACVAIPSTANAVTGFGTNASTRVTAWSAGRPWRPTQVPSLAS
jgi:hypothetical protein